MHIDKDLGLVRGQGFGLAPCVRRRSSSIDPAGPEHETLDPRHQARRSPSRLALERDLGVHGLGVERVFALGRQSDELGVTLLEDRQAVPVSCDRPDGLSLRLIASQ